MGGARVSKIFYKNPIPIFFFLGGGVGRVGGLELVFFLL